MTPEQKREQLLKRLLPALVITVIYFVFISNFITEQKDKAEETYIKLMQKGISPEAIPGMDRQIEQTRKQVRSLEEKQQQLQNKIKEMAGFISTEASNTQAATQLARILAANRLRVTNEESQILNEKQLPPAIMDIKKWLQPGKTINTQHLELRGKYMAMYNALQQMKEAKLQTLPIVFNMKSPKDNSEIAANELQWELVLWM